MEENISQDVVANKNHKFYDDLAEEIISERPSKIENNFLKIIVACLLFIGIIFSFIRYPDTIKVPAVLNSTNPPQKIKARMFGKIKEIYIKDSSFLKKGDKIISFETSADTQQVNNLQQKVETLLKSDLTEKNIINFIKNGINYNNLGDIQQPFFTFLKDLQKTKKNGKDVYNIAALYLFNSKLRDWKKAIQINAPIDGYLHLSSPLFIGNTIEKDQLIAYETPMKDSVYFNLILPQSTISKLHPNMNVRISLNSYPQQQVGFLMGKIQYVSYLMDTSLTATVSLNKGLKTSQDFMIPPIYGLKGDAEIILNDENLLSKIFKGVFIRKK